MRHFREEPNQARSHWKCATKSPQSVEAISVENGAGYGTPNENPKRDDTEAHAHSRSNEATIRGEFNKDGWGQGNLRTAVSASQLLR